MRVIKSRQIDQARANKTKMTKGKTIYKTQYKTYDRATSNKPKMICQGSKIFFIT